MTSVRGIKLSFGELHFFHTFKENVPGAFWDFFSQLTENDLKPMFIDLMEGASKLNLAMPSELRFELAAFETEAEILKEVDQIIVDRGLYVITCYEKHLTPYISTSHVVTNVPQNKVQSTDVAYNTALIGRRSLVYYFKDAILAPLLY